LATSSVSDTGSGSNSNVVVVGAVCVQTLMEPVPSVPTMTVESGDGGQQKSGAWVADQTMTVTTSYGASQIQFDTLILTVEAQSGVTTTTTLSTSTVSTTSSGTMTSSNAGEFTNPSLCSINDRLTPMCTPVASPSGSDVGDRVGKGSQATRFPIDANLAAVIGILSAVILL
jgi:hypothetical protein